VLSPITRASSCSLGWSKLSRPSHLFALSRLPFAPAKRSVLQARSRDFGEPCGAPTFATQDASKPTFAARILDDAHPRLVGSRSRRWRFRATARPRDHVFHDTRSASAGLWEISGAGSIGPPSMLRRDRASSQAVPLIPLSLPGVPMHANPHASTVRDRQARFRRPPVKAMRLPQPEEPSLDDELAPSILRRSPRSISRLCRRDSIVTAHSLPAASPALSRRIFATAR